MVSDGGEMVVSVVVGGVYRPLFSSVFRFFESSIVVVDGGV